MYKFTTPTSCLGIKWIQSNHAERSKSWTWYRAQGGGQNTRRHSEGLVGTPPEELALSTVLPAVICVASGPHSPQQHPWEDTQGVFSLSFMGDTHLKTGFSWYFIFANYFIQTILYSQISLGEEGRCSYVIKAAEYFLNHCFQVFSLGRAALMGSWGLQSKTWVKWPFLPTL